MKKGFTLIELLAVIVILAVIAVIAVPIVLNIINDSKESAVLRSADFYLEGVETAIATSTLKNMQIKDGTYSIMEDGNLCIGTLEGNTCKEIENYTGTPYILKVEMDGEKPTAGTITTEDGQISDISLNLSNKVIVKNDKSELIFKEEKEEPICTLVENGDVAPAGISPGDKYQCKVKDNMENEFKDGYYFYVLSQESNGTTNLIMDRNICEDGTSTKEGKTCFVEYNSSGDASGTGPVTAMTYLNNATSSWKNIDNLNITYDDEGHQFTNFELTGKARLPYDSEVAVSNGTNEYLYENLDGSDWHGSGTQPTNNISEIYGYWTFSTVGGLYDEAWYVYYRGGKTSSLVDSVSRIGVRPVINLNL